MCTNYTPATPAQLLSLGIIDGSDGSPTDWPAETFPGYAAPMVVPGPGGRLQWRVARYGLVPRWCKDRHQADTLSRKTYNARSETVALKPSFRQPWRERRWAVAPMLDFFEPCWETGRAVRWRMCLENEPVFGALGLHDTWVDPLTGEGVQSFSLLTVNADAHGLMRRMHRPQDEKRMLVLLAPSEWGRWLGADAAQVLYGLDQAAQTRLAGEPAPRRADPQQLLAF